MQFFFTVDNFIENEKENHRYDVFCENKFESTPAIICEGNADYHHCQQINV